MAYGIINVARSNPCKICGGPDWCGLLPTDYGYLNICMRATDEDDVLGNDGLTYHYIKTTSGGNKIYESVEQIQVRKKDYINQQKGKAISYKPKELVYENIVTPLNNDILDKIYRDFLSLLKLEKHHCNYLLNEGWDLDLINTNLLRSLPEDDYYRYKYLSKQSLENGWRKDIAKKLSAKYGNLTGVPGFYLKGEEWSFYGLGGLIFPLYDANGYIYRLRIRVDRQYFDNKGTDITSDEYHRLKNNGSVVRSVGKYHNFTSYKEDREKAKGGIICNTLNCGCASSSNIGFYMNADKDDTYACYITEGEKKSIIGNHILNAPFIDIPGVNTYSKLLEYDCFNKRPVDYLMELGTQLIVIAYDADKSLNAKVLDCEKNTVKILKELGFSLAVANWNIAQGKGLDDLLINGIKPQYEFV